MEPGPLDPPARLAHRVDALLFALALIVAAALGALDLDAPWEHGLRGQVGATYGYRFVQHHVELGLQGTRGASVSLVDPLPPHRHFIYANHPMTYPLLLLPGAWLLGATELAVRLGALLLWLPAVPLLWRVLRRLLAPPGPGAGALLFASMPLAAYWGPIVNPDGAILSALLLAALLALRAMERPTRGRLLAFGAAAAACAALDWPGVFIVPMVLLLAWSRREPRGWRLACVAGACVAAGLLLVVAHAAQALGGLGAALSNWLEVHQGTEALQPGNWLGAQAAFLWRWCGPALLGLAGVGAVLSAARGAAGRRLLLAAAALALPGLLNVLAFRRHAFVHDYWALGVAPGLALLAAVPFESALARGFTATRLAVAVVVLLAVAATGSAGVVAQVGAARTTEYRELGGFIQQRFGRGDVVVTSVDFTVPDVYTDATLLGPVLESERAQIAIDAYAPPTFTGRLGFALLQRHRRLPLAAWLEQRYGAPEEIGTLLIWRVR